MSENKHLKEQEDFFKDIFNDAKDYKSQLEEESLADSLQSLAPYNDKRYEELSLIGEGALKQVYLCHDHVIGRDVALARMKPEAHVDDFLNEARLAATLSHPYIAAIHDIGFDDNDQAFFVMELYEGENLQDYLDRHERLSLNELIEIFMKVCEASAFAHSCGVLHLDIKPSNVRIDEFGGILLCDWGISRSMHFRSPEFKGQTTDHLQKISQGTLMGELRGTPDFMAPEQKEKHAKMTQNTDVYGLGALLLCLLQSSSIRGRDKFRLIDELNRPQVIKAICRKCLEKKPEKRYQSVEELIKDLEKFKNNISFSIDGLSFLQIFSYITNRYKRQFIFLVVNLAIFTALISYYRSWQSTQNQRLEQSKQELLANQQREKEQILLEAEEAYIQASLLFRTVGDRALFNAKNLKIAETLITKAIKLNSSKAEYHLLLGKLRFTQKKYSEAKLSFQKAPELFKYFVELTSKVEAIVRKEEDSNLDKFSKILKVLRSYPKTRILEGNLIKRELHSIKKQETKVRWAAVAICLINNEESDQFIFKAEKDSLEFLGEKIYRLYPLRTVQLSQLNLANTKTKSASLWFLNLSPITSLDISYTKVESLVSLTSTLIEELNIAGCKLGTLKHLKSIKHLKVLNIAHFKGDLSPLNYLELKEIRVSKDQEETVRKLVRKDTKIIVIE